MVVLILENTPAGLRGELSRWMIEPRAGVFIGTVSALVRDRLWERALKSEATGGGMLLYRSNTEQGFAVRSFGDTRRQLVEVEGLMLVRIP
jgi:CRISPR-associated protein Cas2